ncbi:uncharacterized protein LOC131938130 [Physella acuta]|uniref:uncharacterized protein LOC131938130 n=1 Tax=Physella acuta TaxID=109671 RepID=UPI0027DD6AAF|nr:uncharacterized protein LOC131938130 [Physella acuta]
MVKECMLDIASSKQSKNNKFRQFFSKPKQEPTNEIDLLIIGKTGNGKSATCNAILRINKFKTNASCSSVTKDVQWETTRFKDTTIKVVDSPGIGDTSSIDDLEQATITAIESMKKAITSHSRGFHAFILVVRFGVRFTAEDKECIRLLKHIFGHDFVHHYCILLVTHGDSFKDYQTAENISFEEWCKLQEGIFKTLLAECDNRVVLFNNVTSNKAKKEEQLEKLLEHVHHLQFVGHRYSIYNFEQSENSRNYIVIKAKEFVIQEEIMREISLIMADKNALLENTVVNIKTIVALKERLVYIIERLQIEDKGTNALEQMIAHVNHIKADFDSSIHFFEKRVIYEEGKNKINKIEQEKIRIEQNYQRLLISQRNATERYNAAKIKEEQLLRENETKMRKEIEMREQKHREQFRKEHDMLLNEKSKLEEECKLIIENNQIEVTKRNEQIEKLRKIIDENNQKLENFATRQKNEMSILLERQTQAEQQYTMEKDSSKKTLDKMHIEKCNLESQLKDMREHIDMLQLEGDVLSRDLEKMKETHEKELIKYKSIIANSELEYAKLKTAYEKYVTKVSEAKSKKAMEKLGQQLTETLQQLQKERKHHADITQNYETNISKMKQQNQQLEESMSKLADKSKVKNLKTPAPAEDVSRLKLCIEIEQQKYKEACTQHNKEMQTLESKILELQNTRNKTCSVQ